MLNGATARERLRLRRNILVKRDDSRATRTPQTLDLATDHFFDGCASLVYRVAPPEHHITRFTSNFSR